VVSAQPDESALRLHVELGSRARAIDPAAWERFVLGGPNPSEQSEIWVFRVEDEPSPVRPPVEYATAGQDERTWRETIERLAPDDDYRAAVFLRVASVGPADEAAGPPLEPPYRFLTERPYLVHVASYNPHLDPDALRDARLVALYDELATAVVVDPGAGVPADGAIDVLVAPIVGGPGWLELNVGLGVDLVPAASLGWVAEVPTAAGPPGSAAQQPVTGVFALQGSDPIAEAAVRAYALVAEEGGLDAGLRLRLLGHLRAIAANEPRLVEREAIVLYELERYDEARRVLSAMPLDTLGADGRATLVAATLRAGRLPDPIDRIRMADLARADSFRMVLDASEALTAPDQVRLTEFAVGRLLSDDRAASWLAELARRPLPADALRRLNELAADSGSQEAEGRP